MNNEYRSINRIFNISSEEEFNDLALEIFNFQYLNTQTYHDFVNYLNISVSSVKHYSGIPFMPIELFKTQRILHSEGTYMQLFRSSGTSGPNTSRHYVKDTSIYKKSFEKAFEYFYGDPRDYCFLALLPSYMERDGSSLIYMFEHLIRKSKFPQSGFYLSHQGELIEHIAELSSLKAPVVLIGVSFALLDFAETFPMNLSGITVMETGGMKGRRKEMLKEELHHILKQGFSSQSIHSEYGMTELLTQAYSSGNNLFETPPWMKILIRDTNDPLTLLSDNKNGGINVIDLANVYSCSFIATQDIGKRYADGSFEVLGRFDNSDIRGCNLLLL
jgi:phenylacetate-coenzyme A ligase PaaK-like adenylate-forming protein